MKIKEHFMAMIGSFITAFAVAAILAPNDFNTSGVTGLAIVLESLTNINYSIISYIITAFIFVVAFIFIGKQAVLKMLFVSLTYPAFLMLIQYLNIELIIEDKILALITFALIYGLGIGIVLRYHFTFGGTDTIAKIINNRLVPFINVNYIMMGLDGLVLLFTGLVFNFEIALYGLVGEIIFTKVIDYVMFDFGTRVYKHEIITEKHEEMAEYIITRVKRGVTIKEITGAYTKQRKVQLSCVCSPKESMNIKKHLASIDKNAYVEVLLVASVWGSGARFKRIDEEN